MGQGAGDWRAVAVPAIEARAYPRTAVALEFAVNALERCDPAAEGHPGRMFL